MEAMRYPLKLNMENTGSLITNIRLKQGDSNITLVLRIYKNGQNIYSPDDIPSIVFNRPDGSAVVGECSIAEGQYTYKMLGNELAVAGQIRADVKFDIYTETESTVTFLFECVTNTLPSSEMAGIYVNSLKNIKDYLDVTVTKLEQELETFDIQQVLDAVNAVQQAESDVNNIKTQIDVLMPEVEKAATVNEALSDYGLNNSFDGELLQGTYLGSDGTYSSNYTNIICTKNKIKVEPSQIINVKFDNSAFAQANYRWYKQDGTYISGDTTTNPFKATVPTNASYCNINFEVKVGSSITPSTAGRICVYVNNSIEQIKADLSAVDISNSYNITVSGGYALRTKFVEKCGNMIRGSAIINNGNETFPNSRITLANFLDVAKYPCANVHNEYITICASTGINSVINRPANGMITLGNGSLYIDNYLYNDVKEYIVNFEYFTK